MISILLLIFVAFALAALPLYFSVKLLGGKTHLLKTMLVNLVVGLVIGIMYIFLPYAALLAFIATIWLYREFFRLRWWKAFVAFFMQGFVALLLILILGGIFGLNLLL